MTPNILLLDCSYELKEKLERQGFSVSSGTMGFSNGTRLLPHQLYESEVIVYNPRLIIRDKNGNTPTPDTINDLSPEYHVDVLRDHLMKGATILVFANYMGDGVDANSAYSWIPLIPKLIPTKDQHITLRVHHSQFAKWHDSYLLPDFIDATEVVRPVRLKLRHRQKLVGIPGSTEEIEEVDLRTGQQLQVVPFLYNKNGDVLGVSFKAEEGSIFVFPTFKSNEDIIATFLNRVLPKIHGVETKNNLVDDFVSPHQATVEKKIVEIVDSTKELAGILERTKEELIQAKLIKAKTIREDETAALVLNYFELAQQQPDFALFFLYKIIEVIERKYGNEKKAKAVLQNNEGWNLIGRIANESYRDGRHAPKPGEKIKEWTREEIQSCFVAAKQIAEAYFGSLFPSTEKENETALS